MKRPVMITLLAGHLPQNRNSVAKIRFKGVMDLKKSRLKGRSIPASPTPYTHRRISTGFGIRAFIFILISHS